MMQRNQDEFGEVAEVGNDTTPQPEGEEPARIETNPTLLAASRKEDDPHHFPTKLHRMLVEIDDNPKYESMKELISWQPHGRCFIIRNEKKFIEKVMSHFFRVIKFSSFRRQLHLFGFRKLSRQGPDKGAYFHEQFIKEKPELAVQMRPVKGQGKRGRKPRSEDLDAAFYAQKNLPTSNLLRGDSEPTHHQEFKQAEIPSFELRPDSVSMQRMPASSLFHGEAFSGGFQNPRELRRLESLSGQIPNTMELRQLGSLSGQAPQYQHNHMPFPSAMDRPSPQQAPMGGLPLPSTFLPQPNPAAEGDVDPFHMQQQGGFAAGLSSDAASNSFLRQPMHPTQLAMGGPPQQLQDNMMNSPFQQQQQMEQPFDQDLLRRQQQQSMQAMMNRQNDLPFQPDMDFSSSSQGQQQMFLQQQQMQLQMQHQQMQQQYGLQQNMHQQESIHQSMLQQNQLLQQQNQRMLEQLQQQQFGMSNNNSNEMFGNDHLDHQGNSNFHDSNNM
ncbi:HSF-type DNA-binding [Seminavis robusta]|uniref:HSF-type DNA-binding n=1 Tax=Seminavis robusta TaxID=568900 RepID=A0A9N8DVJ3_9STRA|nr:HSF-type DNA-binding [Seminavis robusta]|eukprot:Sro392_g133450.1 HSF-type DNA-binding (497) ;mRNA; f:52448-54345